MSTFIENRQRLTDDGILLFLELSAPSIEGTLRIVSDTQDWTRGGNLYTGFPFGFTLPDDSSGQTPRTVLTISNVGRSLTADLEGMTPGDILMARLVITDRKTPEIAEQSFALPVTLVSVNSATVTAQLGVDHLMRQQSVRVRYTPFLTPGIF